MSWHHIITPLGAIVARLDTNSLNPPLHKFIPIFDACFVTRVDQVSYAARGKDGSLTVYSKEEAKKMGYTTDDGMAMEPVSGDPTDEYVPIKPAPLPHDTSIMLSTDNIIMWWDMGEWTELQDYVDSIQGRIEVRKYEVK